MKYKAMFSQDYVDQILFLSGKRITGLDKLVSKQIREVYANGDSIHRLNDQFEDERFNQLRFGLVNYKGDLDRNTVLGTIVGSYMLLKEANPGIGLSKLHLYSVGNTEKSFPIEAIRSQVPIDAYEGVIEFILARPSIIIKNTVADLQNPNYDFRNSLFVSETIDTSEKKDFVVPKIQEMELDNGDIGEEILEGEKLDQFIKIHYQKQEEYQARQALIEKKIKELEEFWKDFTSGRATSVKEENMEIIVPHLYDRNARSYPQGVIGSAFAKKENKSNLYKARDLIKDVTPRRN